MKLQKINSKDIKIIADIYSGEFSKFPWNEKWTFSLAVKKIKDYSTFCDIWKLNLEKELIGFAIINTRGSIGLPGEVAFLEEIVVKKEQQKKGYGTFILKEILKIYKKREFKKIMGIINKQGLPQFYKRLSILPSKETMLVERKL